MRIAPAQMERVTKLALRVLEEALAQAEAEIVEPQVSHRLALDRKSVV